MTKDILEKIEKEISYDYGIEGGKVNLKISIITITYNSEKTVEDTIKSVISQKYDDFEYIIIDGGSTDNTIEIVKKYRDKIAYFVSESDRGICDAFNKGIAVATGDIIGIINSDDLLYHDALTKVAEAYCTGIDIIYGKGKRLYSDGRMEDYLPRNLAFLKYGMALVHPSTFVTKDAYTKYGVFDLKYKGCMDRELLLRMKSQGAVFKYVDEYLSIYRMGGFSDSNYLAVVARERDEISIKYGAAPLAVKMRSKVAYLKIKLKSALKSSL